MTVPENYYLVTDRLETWIYGYQSKMKATSLKIKIVKLICYAYFQTYFHLSMLWKWPWERNSATENIRRQSYIASLTTRKSPVVTNTSCKEDHHHQQVGGSSSPSNSNRAYWFILKTCCINKKATQIHINNLQIHDCLWILLTVQYIFIFRECTQFQSP